MEIKRWEQQPTCNLQKLLPSILQTTEGCSVSVYAGDLNTKEIIESVKKIKNAFPQLPPGFYDVFASRLQDAGFSDARLRDAVNHVIDNCLFPTPTIAQFISYDKRIPLLTYEDMLKKTHEFGEGVWSDYKGVKLPGRIRHVWVHIDDIKKYNIQIPE